ncbi:hypothetical protein ACH4GE_34580 [Streptomyces tendae]|uniref:hypothetical protein n=1 Tax=Streptomyces tendae TaxID=1932 RepID=UPI003799E873
MLLRSRKGTDLTAAFPEIADAALAQLPGDTGLDGELVVWEGERLAFEPLHQRMVRRRAGGRPYLARASGRVRRPAPGRHRPHRLALRSPPDRPGESVRRGPQHPVRHGRARRQQGRFGRRSERGQLGRAEVHVHPARPAAAGHQPRGAGGQEAGRQGRGLPRRMPGDRTHRRGLDPRGR